MHEFQVGPNCLSSVLLANSRAPFSAHDDARFSKACSPESADNFPLLFSQDAGEDQPASGLCGASDTLSGPDKDVAEEIRENDVEGLADGKQKHITTGELDGSESVG